MIYKFIVIAIILVNQVGYSQFQDSTKHNTEIYQLERQLFPHNDKNSQVLFESCSLGNKKVLLVQRKNKPNVDEVVDQIGRIYFLKDSSLIGPLTQLYRSHLEYFQIEWGWALIENRMCEHLKKELQIIEAFERCIYGLKHNPASLSTQEYLSFIIEYSNSHVLPIYYHLYRNSSLQDSLKIHKDLDGESIKIIHNTSIEEMQEIIQRNNQKRLSDYTVYINEKYKSLNAIALDWNIFSPYLDFIKHDILKLYNEYKSMENKMSLKYKLYDYFFKAQLSELDYMNLGIYKD